MCYPFFIVERDLFKALLDFSNSFTSDTRSRFITENAYIRMALAVISGESGMRFQKFELNGKPVIQRYSPAPSAFNVCACSVAQTCPDPQKTGGPFICYYGNNCTKNTTKWTVPGISSGCTYYERLLGSDLRCFYDRTCINTMLSMFNVDMPNRLPLPNASYKFSPLNAAIHSKFSPNTTIEVLFNELNLEQWVVLPNYEGHYAICKPKSCTYLVTERSGLTDTISKVISYFGGLSVTLKLLVPLLVRFAYWLARRWCRRRSSINEHDMVTPEGNLHF